MIHIPFATIQGLAENIVEVAGTCGGSAEVRRLAAHGWPSNRPLNCFGHDEAEVRAAIQGEAQRIVTRVDSL
jgi:hypothetical protein